MELIPKDENPEYVDQLKRLLDSTEEWGEQIKGIDLEHAQNDFMETLSALYMEYFQHHEDEAKVLSLDYASSLSSIFRYMDQRYVPRMWYKLQNTDPEISSWIVACKIKTAIEAYNSLFGHSTGNLHAAEIQNFLEQRKEAADISWHEIPPNAPKSHWWWFAKKKENEMVDEYEVAELTVQNAENQVPSPNLITRGSCTFSQDFCTHLRSQHLVNEEHRVIASVLPHQISLILTCY